MKHMKKASKQLNIFTYGLFYNSPKDDTGSMENPIFSLSRHPSKEPITYEDERNITKVSPVPEFGRPTIWDKDIIIYVMSKIAELKNKNLPYSRTIEFNSCEFLDFAEKGDGRNSYKKLSDSLDRLSSTYIQTTILNGNVKIEEAFHLLDNIRITSKLDTGTVISWKVTICEWLFNAIEHNDILTLNRNYFRLTRTLDRRIYEIARKHCGEQKEFKISLEKLYFKSGSTAPMKKFRFEIKEIAESNHLLELDYKISLEDDIVTFSFTGKAKPKIKEKSDSLSNTTAEVEFKILYPKYCFDACKQDWLLHTLRTESVIKYPKKAFLAFAKSWAEKRPLVY